MRLLPDLETTKKEAEMIRLSLLYHFGSEDRLKEMSFQEKRLLLHWIFDGKDQKGNKYGIFVKRLDKDVWAYYINGKLISGISEVKGYNINYHGDWDDSYLFDDFDLDDDKLELGPLEKDVTIKEYWKNPIRSKRTPKYTHKSLSLDTIDSSKYL
ncbi:MAG: hypothetical protein JRJ41_00910 [Deltaproteobacteria bacterium]|nr:hypothetical protein [Deltaproteobacteria bacterium]